MADKERVMNIEPLLTHYDAMLYLGKYYKVSVTIGRSFPLDAFTKQYTRKIVGQDQIVISAYYYFNADKFIPSVTLRINITETAGESLYSSGTNLLGYIFVSLHNATTDCSTGLKYIENTYDVLITFSP